MAAEFFRRWNDDALVESRRMWQPALEATDGTGAYPMYARLVTNLLRNYT